MPDDKSDYRVLADEIMNPSPRVRDMEQQELRRADMLNVIGFCERNLTKSQTHLDSIHTMFSGVDTQALAVCAAELEAAQEAVLKARHQTEYATTKLLQAKWRINNG